MTDKRLDDAIDRTVREIMSVNAPEQTRARVLARLESKARPAPWFRLAAVTSLAAAALAAFVFVRSRDGAPVPRPVDEPARPPVASVTPAPVRDPASQDQPSPPPLAVRAPDVRTVTAADVDVDVELPFDIDPLATVHPIDIAPIEHEGIGPPSLALTPLAPIIEVQLEPLLPRGERD